MQKYELKMIIHRHFCKVSQKINFNAHFKMFWEQHFSRLISLNLIFFLVPNSLSFCFFSISAASPTSLRTTKRILWCWLTPRVTPRTPPSCATLWSPRWPSLMVHSEQPSDWTGTFHNPLRFLSDYCLQNRLCFSPLSIFVRCAVKRTGLCAGLVDAAGHADLKQDRLRKDYNSCFIEIFFLCSSSKQCIKVIARNETGLL